MIRTLVADDDVTSRVILAGLVLKQGLEPVLVEDGLSAWNIMQQAAPPRIVILDWNMPGLDGLEVCRRIRDCPMFAEDPPYVVILTGREAKADIVKGLKAGANDYVCKPYDREELSARLGVGLRMVKLQTRLTERMTELARALDHVRTLQGILPICSYCKKIRDDKAYWHQVENYFTAHSEARFTHSVCPNCYESQVKPMLQRVLEERSTADASNGTTALNADGADLAPPVKPASCC